jgi:hypothetical protein
MAVAMKKPEASIPTETRLLELDLKTIEIRIEGTSPLITHAWSEKARRMILDKQMGKASKGKEKKDPNQEYENAFYRMPDGAPAFPILAFKAAAVTAVTSLGKEYTKVAARQAFHIMPDPKGGDYVEINYPKDCPPRMREDMVRVGAGVADIRFRPEFAQWGCKIRMQFNQRAISQEQVINLINLGGFAVGVGEHRPEKDGQNGRYQVVSKFSWEK